METNNIPKNLIALIKIFQEVPELFAKKLLEHKVFNDEFIQILNSNAKLNDLSSNPSKYNSGKKIFYSIDDINRFYNQFFKHNIYEDPTYVKEQSVYDAKNEIEVLIIQLELALESEDYIKAAKISEYMKLLNIEYTPKS